mgnify:CR=1 FL=1
MPATLLDGKTLARSIRAELREEVAEFIENNVAVPTLAAVLVGEDAASEVYVRNKRRDCEEVGISSQLHKLPADTSQQDLLKLIAKLKPRVEELNVGPYSDEKADFGPLVTAAAKEKGFLQ